MECRARCMFLLTLNKTDASSYAPMFTGRFLIFLAALLSPFYLWNAISAVIQATHSASAAWLPVWREVLGDILKPAVMLYFGLYFKNHLERRASFKTRKRDALQMTVLCGLFCAVLTPWYVLLLVLAGCVLVYFWDMRDIRRDERLRTLKASYVTETPLRKPL